MSDHVKIELYVGTGFAGCRHTDVVEYPRDKWDAMTEDEKEQELSTMAVDYLHERCECSARVVE